MNLSVRTVHGTLKDMWWHPAIVIRRPGEADFGAERYCGDSHCSGKCGLPGLFLRVGESVLKAHSSMVACGLVWQDKENRWKGERVFYAPGPDEDIKILVKMMWW